MPVTLDPDAAVVFKAFQEAGRPPYETVPPTTARELYILPGGGLVIDTLSGQVQFDNFNGHWGEESQLSQFMQMG